VVTDWGLRDPNRQLIPSDFEIEFERARAEKRRPELAGWARDLDLSGLDFTNGYDDDPLTGIFSHISFIECRMRNCNLKGCSLYRAQLRDVDLSGSVLYLTELKNATLEKVRLDDTDLRGAKLFYAQLNDVSVAHADLTGATFGSTVIQGIDLSSVDGLAGGLHYAPSAIDSVSLRLTAQGLGNEPDFRRQDFFRFLSGAGLDDELLEVVRSWVGQPIEFHSIFLSHSSRDKEFARKLYQDLRSIGIKCWLDEKQLLPGDSILGEIDKGIKLWDRLVLVCSRDSLGPTTGWWVEQELERALAKERELRRKGIPAGTVIPITIDGYVFDEWEGRYQATLLERYIGDFRDQSPESYARSFKRLVESLDRSQRP
jgi:hypothetical protein